MTVQSKSKFNSMKKTVVGVFAHPDDEAFGPGGTLAKLAKTNDVYIICATGGEQGENHNRRYKRTISEIRKDELRRGAKILGVKRVYFLGFHDGMLSNNLYHEVASAVIKRLKILKPQMLLTFEPRGVSGHIDHIAMSMITSYVFKKLHFVKEVWYYCLNKKFANKEREEDYFIYFPPGYTEKDIDHIENTDSVWKTKVLAMKQHKSQLKDVDSILGHYEILPKREHFLVVKK